MLFTSWAEDTRIDESRYPVAPVFRRLALEDYERGFLDALRSLRPTAMTGRQFEEI